LAEGADHDVRGLQIAVNHTARVGEGDGVADAIEQAEPVVERQARGARVEPLADADAEAYGAFMAERTDENVERIIAIPFELAEVAAEVAELAACVAAEGNPNVSGDAAAGADLAAAAASVGARLVRINASPGDERVEKARALAEKAAKAACGAEAANAKR